MTASLIAGDAADHDATAAQIAKGASLGIAATAQDPAYGLLYLASDEARYVTGHTLVIDSGQTVSGGIPAFHNGDTRLIGAPPVA